jgi:hypothetical protein
MAGVVIIIGEHPAIRKIAGRLPTRPPVNLTDCPTLHIIPDSIHIHSLAQLNLIEPQTKLETDKKIRKHRAEHSDLFSC